MPLYEYEHELTDPGGCPLRFEATHSVGESLVRCPLCGGPVRKVVSSFSNGKDLLSTSNLSDHGFTRWRRKDKGVYEKD